MIEVKNNKWNINVLMYVFINFMITILINDYLTYFISSQYIVTILISSILVVVLNVGLKKKFKITYSFTKSDIIFFILLFFMLIITIPYPDRCFDTYNYHLYLQENPFGNKIFSDFFAGKNLNSYSYAFPDRLFYFFRYFLGYRLGTILNYFILVIMYFQVKNIIKKLVPNIKKVSLTLLSSMVIFSISILDIVDSYYIDLISVVILLELFNIMVLGDKINVENKKENILKFALIGLLYGFAFATKISNAPLLVLLFVIYIFMNKNIFKCLTIKNVIITILAFIIPFALYSIYTYLETGNPVFPFYNTIFHSEYYSDTNWLDTRFGPQRLLEVFIWPLVFINEPNRLVDQAIAEPIWCFGYIAIISCIVYYVYQIVKKKDYDYNKRNLVFFISSLLFFIIWAKFQLGYSRYGLIVLILGNISFYVLMLKVFSKKNYFLTGILVLCMIINFGYSVIEYGGKNTFWIYNNYYNNRSNYIYNLKNLFYTNDIEFKPKENSAWAIFYYNSGFAQQFNKDMPIINMTDGVSNEETTKIFDEILEKYEHLYTIVDSLDYNNLFASLQSSQYRVIDVSNVYTSKILGNQSSFIYVFEIEKCKEYCEHKYYAFDTSTDIELIGDESATLWIGLPKDSNFGYTEPFDVEISSNGKLIDRMEISLDGSMKEIPLDNSYKNISLTLKYKDNEVANNIWAMIIYN